MYVDVHAHLYMPQFGDQEEVIERARKAGVVAIVNASTNLDSCDLVLALEKKYSVCKSAFGLYPNETDSLEDIFAFIKRNKPFAIGEIGLDYYRTKDPQAHLQQQEIFKRQLVFAKDTPVVIHSRFAESDVIEILENMKMKKVLLHCFCGSIALVEKAIKHRWFFSIPTRVINDSHFEELAKVVPEQLILTETDSPYMHYEKGKRNEPMTVVESVRKIAQLKGLAEYEMRNIIFQNYQRLFF